MTNFFPPPILHPIKIETGNIIKTGKQKQNKNWHCFILNENVTPQFWPGANQSLHTYRVPVTQQFSDPRGENGRGFFPLLWLQKLFWSCGGFSIAPYCAHIHSRQTTQKSYQGKAWQEQAVLRRHQIGIAEHISGVCIFAVFGGGPTFVVMNRSLVFFAGEEGQWQASPRRECWRRRRESN